MRADGDGDRQMQEDAIHRETRERALRYASERRLDVDYYRIGRKVSYPLPVDRIHLPAFPVADIPNYPWATWLLWAIEERVIALGWSAAWYDDPEFAPAVVRDLRAIIGWPRYDQLGYPDLAFGHSLRILATAHRFWPWLPADLRSAIPAALSRAIDGHAEWFERERPGLTTADAVLDREDRLKVVGNIPLIGTVMAATAARIAGHPMRERLEKHAFAIVTAMLQLRTEGHSEGIAYDGYMLDFIADWLYDAPPAAQRAVLDHPQVLGILDQSIALAAPGNPMAVAALGDVEPRRMPFHASAHAKLASLRSLPQSLVYLYRCPLDWLRADTLGAIHRIGRTGPRQNVRPRELRAGVLDAQYAIALRSGWSGDDLAVAMAASSSAMGHLHRDNGTIVIGTAGEWLIDDAGYQQYQKNDERAFTLGPAAHNSPVVDGETQGARAVERLGDGPIAPGLWRAAIEIAGSYRADLGVESLRRYVWLLGRDAVVVADRIRGTHGHTLAWHWNGHPDAAWWVEDGAALIRVDGTSLRVRCSATPIAECDVDRVPGSRGHLTLRIERELPEEAVVWWTFVLGDEPVAVEFAPDGGSVRIDGRAIALRD